MKNETNSDEISQRAVSLYGQNEGIDDFPVLKAFQQYIDAEQEKARKRILSLGIFFGATLVVVVAVFMILLYGINVRNQTLSDRLVEYAMKEADRRQTVQSSVSPVAVPQNDAALKAMTETLSALQKNIEASNKAIGKRQMDKEIDELSSQKESLRLQRMQNQLEVEKKLLAEERERLRQIEIERQRRKLYPELYENAERRESPSRMRTLTDDDIREIIREAYSEPEQGKKVAVRSDDQDLHPAKEQNSDNMENSSDDDAIEYFKDDDYSIPVDVKGSNARIPFTVPVN